MLLLCIKFAFISGAVMISKTIVRQVIFFKSCCVSLTTLMGSFDRGLDVAVAFAAKKVWVYRVLGSRSVNQYPKSTVWGNAQLVEYMHLRHPQRSSLI